MTVYDHIRKILVVLIMPVLLAGSIGCARLILTTPSFLRGNYTAVDVDNGPLKITDIQFYGAVIFVHFNNGRILTISSMSLGKGDNNRCYVTYRGHSWNKEYSVNINDVCYDDRGNIFFIKFSTEIIARDCEKAIIQFRADNLLVQNDIEPKYKLQCRENCVNGYEWVRDGGLNIKAGGNEPDKKGAKPGPGK